MSAAGGIGKRTLRGGIDRVRSAWDARFSKVRTGTPPGARRTITVAL